MNSVTMRRSNRLAGLKADDLPTIGGRRGWTNTIIGQRQLRSRAVFIELPAQSMSSASDSNRRKRAREKPEPDNRKILPASGMHRSPIQTRSSSQKKCKTEEQPASCNLTRRVSISTTRNTRVSSTTVSSVPRNRVGTNNSKRAVTPSPSPRKLNPTPNCSDRNLLTSAKANLKDDKDTSLPPNVFDLDTLTGTVSAEDSFVGKTFQLLPSTLYATAATDQSQHSSNVGYWFSYAKDFYQYLFELEKKQVNLLRSGVARLTKQTICSESRCRVTRSQARKMEEKKQHQDKIIESYEEALQDTPVSISELLPYRWHREICSYERNALIGNLYSVAEKFGLGNQVLHSAIRLMDMVLSMDPSKMKRRDEFSGEVIPLYLYSTERNALGKACLRLASKFDNRDLPDLNDFLQNHHVTDLDSVSDDEILDMELGICNALKYELRAITPTHFLERFVKAGCVSECNSSDTPEGNVVKFCFHGVHRYDKFMLMAQYLLDLSLLETTLMREPSSKVAAAAVYLAKATLGIGIGCGACKRSTIGRGVNWWNATLQHYTGYSLSELKDIIKLLHKRQREAVDAIWLDAASMLFNKYKTDRCLRVAMSVTLTESDLGLP